MENNLVFETTFQRNLIYVFRINDDAHEGYLKIGDTTIKSDSPSEKLVPNCSELNKAARERINEYTSTAGIEYELLYTELAEKTEIDKSGREILKSFRDHKVHRVLQSSGVHKSKIRNTTGSEWFKIDLKTAINAIKAVKNNQTSLLANEISQNNNPIIFRPEQKDAIKRTLSVFKTSNTMLWNAKMRFGKTICALQVVKELDVQKTLIITHRPVVNTGWQDDFYKIFRDTSFEYISKGSKVDIDKKIQQKQKFIYFKSIQDLRGSSIVGGNFNKNDEIFETQWDFVIIDEAHEGTTTTLGNDVKELLITNNYTKVLELSGTPFNILDKYEQNNVYTWDYMMEQSSKKKWNIENYGDSNPYEDLPEMRIFTYDLGESLGVSEYDEIEDKAFNFKEFFRTWTGEKIKDHKEMPCGVKIGDFIHEKDILAFLNLITHKDLKTNYPYSTEEYRDFFKHSLWMVPGVKEARALSTLMKRHPVFGSGQFEIINIAGDGDEEDLSQEALTKVRNAIDKALQYDTYTITLSCGKLTTGVTVPEWTAVMMLSGSYSTSAANYLQTIFRVQSPANINGMLKKYCYVFDFAPDRTLKMVADAVKLSTKAGKTTNSDRKLMGEFLNFCPVVSFSGTQMIKYDESKLLQQLKKAYADRAVKSGFDNVNLYNDELLKLTDIEIQRFDELKKIVGSSSASPKIKDIDINNQGLTNEEYAEVERIKKKPKRERTPEEEAKLEELNKQKEQRNKAISILRAISIRIPLLIYGADFNDDTKIITIQDLLKEDIVDDASWIEFMPKNVTKELFKEFIKYYDLDVFNAASQKIRKIVKYADTLYPTERVFEIAKLFSYFKNPDKETVLTPWRVVNMHLGDCLGGYNFYDEKYENVIDNPRFIDKSEVTNETLNNANSQILEINSKTGLYPLYVAYSIFRSKCLDTEHTSLEEQQKLWKEVVENNIFIICKTPMAKFITKRTLSGFNEIKINAHYFEDLINTIQHKPKQFIEKIKKPHYWNKKDKQEMKFDAIVGNPPYQLKGGSGGNNDAPIYQHFAQIGDKMNPSYLSLIMPARWFSAGRENLLAEFRRNMLSNEHLSKMFVYVNPRDVFPSVEIKGGICYYLLSSKYTGDCEYTLIQENISNTTKRNLNHFDVLIRDPNVENIVRKVINQNSNNIMVDTIISSDTPFGISSNPKSSKKNKIEVYETSSVKHNTFLYYIEKNERKINYINKNDIHKNAQYIDRHKVFIPGASGSGSDPYVLGRPEYAPKNSVCSQSYLYAHFDSELEATNFILYFKTKFFRLLVSAIKISQSAPSRVYKFVPLQNFQNNSDIDWSKSIREIDKQLYKKYDLTDEEIDFIEKTIQPME